MPVADVTVKLQAAVAVPDLTWSVIICKEPPVYTNGVLRLYVCQEGAEPNACVVLAYTLVEPVVSVPQVAPLVKEVLLLFDISILKVLFAAIEPEFKNHSNLVIVDPAGMPSSEAVYK